MRLAADDKVATVLGSIPESFDTVESEGRRMKQCWKKINLDCDLLNGHGAGVDLEYVGPALQVRQWELHLVNKHFLSFHNNVRLNYYLKQGSTGSVSGFDSGSSEERPIKGPLKKENFDFFPIEIYLIFFIWIRVRIHQKSPDTVLESAWIFLTLTV